MIAKLDFGTAETTTERECAPLLLAVKQMKYQTG